jgi:hypothetical protein
MNHDSAVHPLFHPQESAALFGPEEHELILSPNGLHYLGIVPQSTLCVYLSRLQECLAS